MKWVNTTLSLICVLALSALFTTCERKTSPASPNVPPRTTLANIPVEDDTLFALQTLHWDGEDDDGFISRYQYRYITRHEFRGDSVVTEWQETSSTSLTIAFESSDSLNYQKFQVRAVDNNGTVDPQGAEKRFYTTQTLFPQTTILAPLNNQKTFAIDHVTDWYPGVELSFTATDPEDEGEVVEYGWIVDGGDTTWTTDTTLFVTPDHFAAPLAGTHEIRVTSRDNTNLIDPVGDVVTVELVVPTFTRDIIIIDETNEANFPFGVFPGGTTNAAKDDSVDAFYQELFGPAREWDYFARGMPPLDTLGRYKMMIWHADDSPTTTGHALPNHVARIQAYMNVGGDFIMSGWRMLKSFAFQEPWGEGSAHNFEEGTFIHDYLHITSANETPLVPSDFDHAEPFGGFPPIRVDADKLSEFPYFGKLVNVNIMPGRGGFTEVIYTYQNDVSPTSLIWPRGQPVGLRYYGTSFDAVIFGFPIFFIEKEDALALGHKILESMGYR